MPSKPSLLSKFKPAAPAASPGLTLESLMDMRQAAEAALAVADAAYGKAAMDFAETRPGATQELVGAEEAQSLARSKLRAVMAAQIELEAAERERSRQAARDAQDAADQHSRQVYADQAKVMAEGADVLRAYVDWFARAKRAEALVQAEAAANPRLREVHLSLEEAVKDEIARVSPTLPFDALPPGANVAHAAIDNRHDFEPMARKYAARAAAV